MPPSSGAPAHAAERGARRKQLSLLVPLGATLYDSFYPRSILFAILCLLILLGASGCARPGATNSAERVRIDRVVLLSTEAQLSANLTAEQLAAFVRDARAQIAQTVTPNTPALRLIVQFTLQPRAGQIVQITTHDGADTALVARLTDALRLAQPLYTRSEPVMVQVYFSTN
jgi:hypothetical protein